MKDIRKMNSWNSLNKGLLVVALLSFAVSGCKKSEPKEESQNNPDTSSEIVTGNENQPATDTNVINFESSLEDIDLEGTVIIDSQGNETVISPDGTETNQEPGTGSTGNAELSQNDETKEDSRGESDSSNTGSSTGEGGSQISEPADDGTTETPGPGHEHTGGF